MAIHDAPVSLSSLQAPLVIGVSGHRDLRPEDIAHLEKNVRSVFRELHDRYPYTPFVLLSSLAEGADRLVARLALEDPHTSLIVPLPLPQALFEADFEGERSKIEFRGLLSQAAYSFEVAICSTLAEVEQDGPARDLQYAEAGRYIARQSQLLLALWDGVDNHLTGGTAAIVRFQTEGPSEAATCSLEAPEVFPTYRIVTPRLKNPHPLGTPFALTIRYPKGFSREEKASEYFHHLFGFLDEFNQDVARAHDAMRAEMADSMRYVIPHSNQSKLLDSERLTLERYGVSDALAIDYRRKMMRTQVMLHWIIFAAFLLLVLFAHMPHPEHPTPAIVLAMVLFLTAWALHERALRLRFDSKHQDYRAIAEGLRVRLFWQIAGIEDSVADNYLGKQRSELDWIRNGLRGWGIGLGQQGRNASSSTGTLSPADCLKVVLVRWVNDQRRYFRRAVKLNHAKHERKERLIRMLMWGMLATAAILIVFLLVRWVHGEWFCEACESLDWPIIILDLLLAGGALLHHFVGRMGYSEHSKQYKRMAGIFRRASRLTSARLQANDLLGARECLRVLGREALAENGDWVLLHRERPLEMPHP